MLYYVEITDLKIPKSIKLLVKMENLYFILQKKTTWTFWPIPYLLLQTGSSFLVSPTFSVLSIIAVDIQIHLILQFLFVGLMSGQVLEVFDLTLGSSRAFSASQHAQPPSSRGLMLGRRLAFRMPGSSWESKMPGKSFCRKMPVSGSKGKCRMPERCWTPASSRAQCRPRSPTR